MTAYKIEIFIIDHEDVGEEQIKEMIESAKYPNYCIAPCIKNVESADIGEWSDDHPLNKRETADEEYQRLFGLPF